MVCDVDMRYVWVNDSGAALMGYRADDLLGQNFLVNFPERMHHAMSQAYRAQLAGQVGTFTGTLLRPDGTELDIVWSNMTFVHGGRRYGAAIFRDVTRQVAVTRAASGLARAAETTARGGDLVQILTQLAEAGRENTRALAVALDLVDDDLVIRRGGRSGVPAGFAEAQTAVSAAGGRIPFIDVWYSGRAVVLADARTRLRQDRAFVPLCDALDAGLDWQTAVYVAIGYEGEILGGLAAYFPAGVPSPTDAELSFLTTLADYAAVATGHARLREISERTAALEERARLARDLHDSVSQALFSMTMHARAAEKTLARIADGEPLDARLPRARADVSALRGLTSAALAEMRALLFELRPDALAEHGLVAALERQAAALSARTGVSISVAGPPDPVRLPGPVAEQAYRVAVEAMTNAVKHAGTDDVRVAVADLGDAVEVRVCDDGPGFDPTAVPAGHFGLVGMRERAERIGADLEVASQLGIGTRVRLTLPVDVPAADDGGKGAS